MDECQTNGRSLHGSQVDSVHRTRTYATDAFDEAEGEDDGSEKGPLIIRRESCHSVYPNG